MEKLNSKIPEGPLANKWTKYKSSVKLVNPANKKKLEIIVIGTGLSGAGAASSLGELGYSVKNFCYQDSPRRAHSVAAQGGINAAKNYQSDGDSTYRLFYDMIKGETSEPVKPMYTGLQRSVTRLLTIILRLVYHLPVIMEGHSIPVHSEGFRYQGHFMPRVRRVSSVCWEPILHLTGR